MNKPFYSWKVKPAEVRRVKALDERCCIVMVRIRADLVWFSTKAKLPLKISREFGYEVKDFRLFVNGLKESRFSSLESSYYRLPWLPLSEAQRGEIVAMALGP